MTGIAREALEREQELAAHIEAADQMLSRAVAAATRRNRAKTMAHYQRWADANGEPYPATEKSTALYLGAHYKVWGHGTSAAALDNLRGGHLDAGYADPSQGRPRELLRAVASTKGKRARARTQPLDPSVIAEATARELHSEQPGGRAMELRALVPLLLHHQTHVTVRRAVAVTTDAILVDADGMTLQLPAETVQGVRHPPLTLRVRRTGGPLCLVAMVEELIALEPPSDARLLGFQLQRPSAGEAIRLVPARDLTNQRLAVAVASQLDGAARRAGLDGWEALPLVDRELRWLAAHVNPNLIRQLRDLTYAIVGSATLSRHSSLERLEVGHINRDEDGDGWVIHFVWEKCNQEGRDDPSNVNHRTHHLVHEGVGDECAPWCPACLLDTWLSVIENSWNADATSLVLPAMRGAGGPSGPLKDWYGTLILRRLTGRQDVSTRSLRAGSITALRAEGVSLEKIAEASGHKTISNLTRYLRLLSPHTEQYHHDVRLA